MQESIAHQLEPIAQAFSPGKLLFALVMVSLGAIASSIVARAFARAERRRGRDVQRVRRARPVIDFAIWISVLLIIGAVFAESLVATVLLAALVLIGAAAALGPLLRDVVGGLVVLFERPFQIGDRVSVAGREGEVTEIGWRTFRLQTPDGALIAAPNREVLRAPVINRTRGEIESRVETRLSIPPESDLATAQRRAYEAAAASPYLYIGRPVEVYLRDRGQLVVAAHVFDAEHAERFSSDVIERWEQSKGAERAPEGAER